MGRRQGMARQVAAINKKRPAVKRVIVSAQELKRMDDAARKRDIEAFARNPSMRMPLSGYAKRSVVAW